MKQRRVAGKKGHLQLRALAGYLLLPGAIGLFFALFVDVRFGFSFLLCLTLLPIISVMQARIRSRRIKLRATLSGSVLSKGDSATLAVEVDSDLSAGFSELELHFGSSPRLACEQAPRAGLVLTRRTKDTLQRRYTARIWGVAQAGVEGAWVVDFLRLCRYPVALDGESGGRVTVLPEIPRLPENELLRAAIEAGMLEEEEDLPDRSLLVGGVPGYEHRGYRPGDSLRHINWKLSAKRDEYMVRLPEPVSRMAQTLVLDPYMPAAGREELDCLLDGQLLVETLLGVCRLLVRQQMECRVFCRMEDGWLCEVIAGEQDLQRLQFTLAGFGFHGDPSGPRLPGGEAQPQGSLLVFTPAPGAELATMVEELAGGEAATQFIQPKCLPAALPHTWLVDNDFSILRA